MEETKSIDEQDLSKRNLPEWVTIPNGLTALRIAGSVGLLMYILNNGLEAKGLILTSTALLEITDFLDGYIARHFHMQSKLGGVLDPIADKIFAYGIGAVLIAKNIMPLWPLLIIARDVAVWTLTAVMYWKTKERLAPTMPAKLKTTFQMASILSTFAFGWDFQLSHPSLGMMAPVLWGTAMAMAIPEIFTIRHTYFKDKKKEPEEAKQLVKKKETPSFR